MRLQPQDLDQVLSSGLMAPSADNKHHLRFAVGADDVALLSTDQPAWLAQPHRQCLALLSCGAVLENMALRSEALGYTMQAELLPDRARPALMAQLRWRLSNAPPDPLYLAIEGRHTNRRFFSRAAVPAPALARVTAAAQGVPGAGLLWLADPRRRAQALKALRLAETHRFQRRGLHDELFGAIQFQRGWRRSAVEGLPPGALEVEPPLRPVFTLLRHWPLMQALNRLGGAYVMGLRAGYLPCALAPHLGLVRADQRLGDAGWLQAGRVLERIWLAAAAEGLALQPMAAAPALVQQQPSAHWVSATVQARLQHLLSGLSDEPGMQACLFFRLGLAPAPSVVTERPPLASFMAASP